MRLLAWNLNHRAARRKIPAWVSEAVGKEAPDVVILTEYVAGPDHERFLAELKGIGLGHAALTARIGRSNQVLIAARDAVEGGPLRAPDFEASVPPNFLHVVLPLTGLNVVGFRMPAFTPEFHRFKRETFVWLEGALESIKGQASIVAGDFNTDPGDAQSACGDCLASIVARGWRLSIPPQGRSWPADPERKGRCIDLALLSPRAGAAVSSYSWDFRSMNEEARKGWVGRPDHAMLLVDLEPARV